MIGPEKDEEESSQNLMVLRSKKTWRHETRLQNNPHLQQPCSSFYLPEMNKEGCYRCGLFSSLSAFSLPCKIWGLNFSMLQKSFIRVEFFFVQTANNFFHAAKLYIMQLWLELFLVISTKIVKNCQLRRISWPDL